VSKTVAKRNARTERAGPRGNLLEEARRLDTVRAAVEAGNGSAARRELTEYRSRFPRGELALEADVLEADLLLLAGQPERARTLANALLSRPDSGRYRQRLEQLLQRAHASELRGGSNPARANMVESR
jgi:ATP/maltotriose-dependent transcriptional regulator MalT